MGIRITKKLAGVCAVVAALGLGAANAAPVFADASNVTETSANVGLMHADNPICVAGGDTVSGASFSVPNAGDWIVVQAGDGFDNSTLDPLGTPTDTQGNTFTLLASSGVPGTSTGHWSGIWMAQAASAGTDTITWACPASLSNASGAVIGTFTSNGTNHMLSVDASGGTNWNYSLSGLTNSVSATTSGTTSASGDLVVNGGFIREHAWLNFPIVVSGGESTLNYSGVSYSGGLTSGTQWSDHNAVSGTTNWASGSQPTETYNFTANGGTAYKLSVGSLEIVALIAS